MVQFYTTKNSQNLIFGAPHCLQQNDAGWKTKIHFKLNFNWTVIRTYTTQALDVRAGVSVTQGVSEKTLSLERFGYSKVYWKISLLRPGQQGCCRAFFIPTPIYLPKKISLFNTSKNSILGACLSLKIHTLRRMK